MVDVVGLRYVDQGREQVIAGTKQYTTAVDQAAQATTRAAATTTRATRATSVQTDVVRANAQAHQFASRSMNATGMALQQTGYQVGDFLVQVQSGTNWMVAFGQQATQLVGVLPMFGSVMGVSGTALLGLSAGLGIAIPLVTAIGAAFMRTSGEASTFKQAIGDLETAVSDYSDAMDLARGSSEAVREEFGFTSDLLAKLVRDFEALAEIKALDSIGTAVDKLRSEHISGFESDIENIKDLLGETGWFAAAGEAVAQFDTALLRLENRSLSLDERLASALNLRDQLLEVSGGIDGMTAAQRSFYDALLQTIQQMETFRGLQSDAREEARLDQAMNEETARQQAALLEENARYEQEVAAKREQAAARHLTTQAAIYQAYADSRTEADALSKSLVEAYRAGEDLSSADVGAGVDAAAIAAAELAKQMGISLSLAQGMVALGSGLAAPGGPDQARENVRNTYSGIAGLREEDIVARITRAARIPSGGRGGGGGGGGAAAAQDDYLQNLLDEAEQKRRLVGLTEEETRRQEILFELKKRELPLNDERIEQIIQAEAETRKLMEAEQQRQQLMDTVEGHIQSAFMAMVDGSSSVEDAFRNMLRNIILAIYEQQVAEPAARGIGNFLSGAIGGLFGPGMTTGTPLQIPSSGVGSLLPSFDGGGYTGTGARSGGLDGRGGMLAMVHPNETVVDHSKGQSMGNVTVVQNFNIAANGDDSVRRIVRSEAPRIAEQAKAAVVDAKRRGGAYGRSF